jgi:L-threonylcarbamoyladenylate synthase
MQLISGSSKYGIKKAARALKSGHLVAFPTETVYGLGGDATNQSAVERIFQVKSRPRDHPLIVHISSIEQAAYWVAEFPSYALTLAEQFWPGPMTLIFKRSEIAKDFLTGEQEFVGLRIPSNLIALDLLSEFEKMGGMGVAAPSANKFGAVSPTTALAVKEELGNSLCAQDIILNGGASLIGIESTIIKLEEGKSVILRPGAITEQMINKISKVISIQSSNNPDLKVSGSFGSHYAPKTRVFLSLVPQTGDGMIADSKMETPHGVIRLSSPDTVDDYARDLYASFRLGDKLKVKRIIAFPPKGNGLAMAIRDRIERASNITYF